MQFYQRISAKHENFTNDDALSIIDILDKYLLKFSYDSIYKIITENLAREHFYQQCYTGRELYDYSIKITKLIEKNRFTNKLAEPRVLLTRANSLLILNYINYKKNNLGNTTIDYSDLYYLLLDLNKIEEDDTPDIRDVKRIKDLTENDIYNLVANCIKPMGLQNTGTFNLPNIDRNYKLIEYLLTTSEGINCNNDFIQKYGFDILEYTRITYFTYLFIYTAYSNNDFSNIIDFNKIFNSLITPNSPEYKLIQSFNNVYNKLSSSQNQISINNIKFYDTLYLWSNNIIKIGTDKFKVTDIGLYTNAAFCNVYFQFEEPYLTNLQNSGQSQNNQLRSKALGDGFEFFCNSLLNKLPHKNSINNIYQQKKAKGNNEIADIFFNIGDTLFYIECKAGFLAVNDIISLTPTDLLNKIFKKYGGKYIDETHYTNLPSNEKKGVLQIIHNYSILDEAIKNNNYSIYNIIEPEKFFKKIKKIYGIVLVQEPYLSTIGLNTLLYMYNKKPLDNFNSKQFNPPIIIHINDLYKIINAENKPHEQKLTFEKAIKNYITTLHDNERQRKFYSFNNFIVEKWKYPNEINQEEYDKMCKTRLNELYSSVGLPIPNP